MFPMEVTDFGISTVGKHWYLNATFPMVLRAVEPSASFSKVREAIVPSSFLASNA